MRFSFSNRRPQALLGALLVAGALLGVGCGRAGYAPVGDAGASRDVIFYQPDAVVTDAGADAHVVVMDASTDDAATSDGGVVVMDDASTNDATTAVDASTLDANDADASVVDAALMDAAPVDLGVDMDIDMGVDLGEPDMGPADAGVDAAIMCPSPVVPPSTCSGLDMTAASAITVPGYKSVVAADFTNDGNVDLLFVEASGGAAGDIALLPSNGDPTAPFQAIAMISSSIGNAPEVPQVSSIAAGDLNNDGVLDIVYGNAGSSMLTVSLQDTQNVGGHTVGTGTFGAGVHISAVPAGSPVVMNTGSIVIADFNGDLHADIAAAAGFLEPCTYGVSSGCTDDGGYLAILFGDGNGVFMVPDAGASSPTFTQPDPIAMRDGFGACITPITPAGGYAQLNDLIAQDFNHDGAIDLAWRPTTAAGSITTSNYIGIALNDSHGGFTQVDGDCGDHASPRRGNGLVSADWDGDGQNDLIMAMTLSTLPGAALGGYQSDGVAVWLTSLACVNPSPSITDIFSGSVNAQFSVNNEMGWSLVVADFNCDGKGDVAMKHIGGGGDVYMQDMSDSSIPSAASLTVGGIGVTGKQSVVGDFNNDGRADFVVFSQRVIGATGTFQVVMNH